MSAFVLHFDGACWPNPGGTATFGWILLSPFGAEVASGNGVAATGSDATNNVAEYSALLAGLRSVVDMDPEAPLVIRGDSKLVINQIEGRWKCNGHAETCWRWSMNGTRSTGRICGRRTRHREPAHHPRT